MMYVLGIDVGTTGTKAILLEESGAVAAQGYQGYDSIRGSGGAVEQNAEDWWRSLVSATRTACAEVDSAQVRGLCLSTQGGSSLLVDGGGNPLHNAMSWMDMRAASQKRELERRKGSGWFYDRTGWPLNPSLDACKGMWLKGNRPELLADAAYYLSTAEFVNLRLTGNPVIDPTNAAMRQLMSLQTLEWDPEILDLIGLSAKLLPEIRRAGAEIGRLAASAASALGLHTDVRVFNGAHDQYCCGLGSGSVETGDTYLGTGTAWVLMHNTEKPLFTSSRISPGPHIIPGMWSALSSVSCGGVALEWVNRNAGQEAFREIDREAALRMGRHDGLLFYPYFTGAGCPHWNSDVRGVMMGLELQHDRYDLALAAMEGVAFQTAVLLDEYRAHGAVIDRLRVMGGGGKSGPWMEILGAAGRCGIDRVKVTDAAPLGAAMIAAVGCGMYPDYAQAARELARCEPLEPPSGELREYYRKKFTRYLEHWPQIRELYEQEGNQHGVSLVSQDATG